MDNNIASVQQLTKHYDTKASAEPSEGSEENSLAQLEQKLTAPGLSNKELGAIGEQYAAAWLGKLGWQVLARNWKTRFGELDIIMITGEHIVVFVEAKTRRARRFGTPQEAITSHKQAHLRHAAALWLAGPGKSIYRTGIRFDAISILLEGNAPKVQHIPGAF